MVIRHTYVRHVTRSPLWTVAALAVLPLLVRVSPLEAQHVARVERVEGAAEATRLVSDYYEWLRTPDCSMYVSITRSTPEGWLGGGLYRPLCRVQPECQGASLWDCMGGETVCESLGTRCDARATAADRGRLLESLNLAGSDATESDWVVGQRVNLALKNGELESAQGIADSCQASVWWCQALRGYTRHRRLPGAGEEHLDSAIANVPPDTTAWPQPKPEWDDPGLPCAWKDLSLLLSGSLLSEYGQLPCEHREDFEDRFWWLADPLWSVEGNERRTEHLARNVQLRLDEDLGAVSPSRRSGIIPAGWPNSWRSFIAPLRPSEDPARMTRELRERHELYVRGGYSFAPDVERYSEPGESRSAAWSVEWDTGTERMITAEAWHNITDHQTAVLRRGEGLLAVSAAQLPVIVQDFGHVRAALAMGRPADRRIEVAPASVDENGVVRAVARVEGGEWLASIEMFGDGWRGRLREGAPAPPMFGGFGVSDPILVRERPQLEADSLAQAIMPSTAMNASTGVGVYFEVYGVDHDERLEISVSVERAGRSLFKRIIGVFGLASSGPSEVNWSEPADTPTPNRMSRYLELDLGDLEPGEYHLGVAVRRQTGEAATSSRSISLR